MFFEERDPIAVHTLTAAARGILRDLVKHRGGKSIIEEDNLAIPPKHRKEFLRKVHESQNFFKHANQERDPEAQIEFRPTLTEVLLLDAVFLCRRLTGLRLREGEIFRWWFALHNPDLFVLDQQTKELLSNAAVELNADRVERRHFYAACQRIVSGDEID